MAIQQHQRILEVLPFQLKFCDIIMLGVRALNSEDQGSYVFQGQQYSAVSAV